MDEKDALLNEAEANRVTAETAEVMESGQVGEILSAKVAADAGADYNKADTVFQDASAPQLTAEAAARFTQADVLRSQIQQPVTSPSGPPPQFHLLQQPLVGLVGTVPVRASVPVSMPGPGPPIVYPNHAMPYYAQTYSAAATPVANYQQPAYMATSGFNGYPTHTATPAVHYNYPNPMSSAAFSYSINGGYHATPSPSTPAGGATTLQGSTVDLESAHLLKKSPTTSPTPPPFVSLNELKRLYGAKRGLIFALTILQLLFWFPLGLVFIDCYGEVGRGRRHTLTASVFLALAVGSGVVLAYFLNYVAAILLLHTILEVHID